MNDSEISSLIAKIFTENVILVDNNCNQKKDFYCLLDKYEEPKLLIPKHSHCNALSYLQNTTKLSKIKLLIFKVLYKFGLLNYLNNIRELSFKGMDSINWSVYGWDSKIKPEIIISFGTNKKSRNAVSFLISSNVSDCLILKSSIGEASNLENEYHSGIAIKSNNTKYISFNYKKGFLSQKYIPGFRKVSKLNTFHINFLSNMILDNTKKGHEIKKELLGSMASLSKICVADKLLLEECVDKIHDNFDFHTANVHGDFASFNVIYLKSSELFSVIDWENSCINGLAFVDLFNYIYLDNCLFYKKNLDKIEGFVYRRSKEFINEIDPAFNRKKYFQYKYAFIVSEYLKRLDDADNEDVYVRYLLREIRNEC